MKSVIENLQAVLRHMSGIYVKLLAVAEEKREAIIKGDIAALEEVVATEYKLLEMIQQADKVRVGLSTQAEEEYRIPKGERPVKLKRLIAALGAEEGKTLTQVQSEIRDILDKFRYRNRQNQELLKSSLIHVNDFMNMIKECSGRNKTYNKLGRECRSGLNLLDRRA